MDITCNTLIKRPNGQEVWMLCERTMTSSETFCTDLSTINTLIRTSQTDTMPWHWLNSHVEYLYLNDDANWLTTPYNTAKECNKNALVQKIDELRITHKDCIQ